MGAIQKVMDGILSLFFMFIAIGVPIIDTPLILPPQIFPEVLVDFRQWYIRQTDYYLHIEKPTFFIGITWIIFLFEWPLSLFNLYGLLRNKSWFPTTCLMSGVSVSTLVAILLFETIESGKASNKLLILFSQFMGFGILATLRGLVPPSKTVSGMSRSTIPGKKTT